MIVVETERLALRHLTPTDAPFILELLNDPDWLRYIGDRHVHTVADARSYIETGPARMYAHYGFGLYLTELKGGQPIGLCGLLKRDFLEDVDIGFAFLPRFRGAGYAFEAAIGVLGYAASVLALKRVVAITDQANERSARLLEKLGLCFECLMPYPGQDEEVRLFARTLSEPTDGEGASRSSM